MSVPSSGELTMLGIAKERKFGNYYSSSTLGYPILITDLIDGGGLNGFPNLNEESPYLPSAVVPYSLNDWYGYRQKNKRR
jgi:hypothetical protein